MILMAMGALALAPVTPAVVARGRDDAVTALVERFEAARMRFDPAALAETLAPEYEEISPIGDVDTRTEVLGFYAPEAKRPAPAMTRDQLVVRGAGDTAIVTSRTSFTPPGAPPRAVRVRYVARLRAGKWLLVSSQYTPIPPPRPS